MISVDSVNKDKEGYKNANEIRKKEENICRAAKYTEKLAKERRKKFFSPKTKIPS